MSKMSEDDQQEHVHENGDLNMTHDSDLNASRENAETQSEVYENGDMNESTEFHDDSGVVRSYTEVQNNSEHNTTLDPDMPQDRILQLEMYYGESLPSKFVTLEIVNAFVRKPFLGGYRHKLSQVEYHHAATQTDKPLKERNHAVRMHRETQTKKFKSRSQQTDREQGTQMEKPGISLDDQFDRIVELPPLGTYFDSEQLDLLRLKMAIRIQSFVRGWRARRLALKLHRQKMDNKKQDAEEDRQQREKEDEVKRKEINRRMHPKTKKDFDVMYAELEQWRLQETAKIQSGARSEEEKKQGLHELLRKQVKLLQTIDRLKNTSAAATKYDAIHTRLHTMSKPKEIPNATYDHKSLDVETPFTIRARELMELYHGLNTDMLSVDERLDVLLHVKWTVKEFDCRLTREIVDLIDREADLLNRGRKEVHLEGLRKRLANLFLQFVETPEFNPEALRFVKVPLENTRRDHVQLLTKK
jgi:hypothetical protein